MSACQSAMMLCGEEINTGMTHSTCVPYGYHTHWLADKLCGYDIISTCHIERLEYHI